MADFLSFFVFILFVIVIITLINEKLLKIPNEIVLLLFSLIIGISFLLLFRFIGTEATDIIMERINAFRLDKVLLDVLLCFMLFTGASELKLPSLVHNFKPICLLAFLTTVITSLFYGFLLWLVTLAVGMKLGFTLCFLLGSIVSPTDPIAATGILNKMGLTKNVTAVMEGESLFNDGTGVALFIFLKDLYLDTKENNFLIVMSRELFGAVLVGLVVSFAFSFLIKATKDPIKHIIISMLSVGLCYTCCESFGFSGVIASVICGIYFSTMMDRYKDRHEDIDPDDYYKDFWSIIDKLLNYILYVLIGISFVYVKRIDSFVIISIAAVIINLVARYIGVFGASFISRQCPDGYKMVPFSILMSWSGLKGGLCLALAMSTMDFLGGAEFSFVLYVTFVTIIFTTIVQGLTVGKVFNYIKRKWGEASDN